MEKIGPATCLSASVGNSVLLNKGQCEILRSKVALSRRAARDVFSEETSSSHFRRELEFRVSKGGSDRGVGGTGVSIAAFQKGALRISSHRSKDELGSCPRGTRENSSPNILVVPSLTSWQCPGMGQIY